MDTILSPRQSGEFIAKRSKDVYIVKNKMESASNALLQRMLEVKFSKKTWKVHELHPKEMNDAAANWIFVVDCLNFSFWVEKEQEPFMVEFRGKLYSDYEALCAIVNRALEENAAFTSPDYYKDVTLHDAKLVFCSATTTDIPLLEKRVDHLREAGRVLCSRYGSSIANLIRSCEHSALRLVKTIVSEISSFKDEGVFEGQRVSFYKRAQIFVADLWACFEGEGLGRFDDINELTMFADYRVPQCLQYLGIIQYSEKLAKRINNEEIILSGSKEEMEIRGCSIHVVECLRESIKNQLKNDTKSTHTDINEFNSVIIDFYLWDFATLNFDQMVHFPEHRTRTHFY